MNAPAVAGIGTVRPHTTRISQIVTVIAVVVPPLGLVSAMGLLWGVAFHWVDVALFAGLYVVCAFGTTLGFHRYFTHRGFETSDRKSTRLNSSHIQKSRMPSSA